jgi:hypothetical protein
VWLPNELLRLETSFARIESTAQSESGVVNADPGRLNGIRRATRNGAG